MFTRDVPKMNGLLCRMLELQYINLYRKHLPLHLCGKNLDVLDVFMLENEICSQQPIMTELN